MSSYENLMRLWNEELEILKNEQELLKREGFTDPYLVERIKKLEYFLPFLSDNADSVFTMTQASEISGLIMPEDKYTP